MQTMDDLSEWVEDCCETAPDAKESNRNLFGSFAEWKRERAEIVPSRVTWSERVRQQLGLESYKSNGARGFKGIRLKLEEIRRLTERNII